MSRDEGSLRVYYVHHPSGRCSGYLLRKRANLGDPPPPAAFGTHEGEVRWAVGNDLVPWGQLVSCVTGKPLPPPRDASPVTVVRAPAKYLARSKRELAAKKAADSRREREKQKRKPRLFLYDIIKPKWHLEFVKKEDSD